MREQRSGRNRIILGVLIIASIFMLTLFYRQGESGFFGQARRAVSMIVTPLQIGASKVVAPFSNGWQYLGEIGGLKEKNTKLEERVDQLKKKNIALRQMEKENKRLKKLLKFEDEKDFVTASAYVIGRSVNSWEKTIVLDKGSSAGIDKDMPVVASDGLVFLEYISKDSAVKKGSEVITSGLGGVFPKGIYIGKITKLKQSQTGLYKSIKIDPAVNFSGLEEVLIITNAPGPVESGI